MAKFNSEDIDPQTLKPWVHEVEVTPPKQEIIPLNDRVLIEPIITDNYSAGGIIVAGDEGAILRAKVLAVGAGRNMPSGRIPIDVAVGDIVIYGELNNTVEEKLNGKKVLLVVEQAIVAIIKG